MRASLAVLRPLILRPLILPALVLLALAGCARPAPSDYARAPAGASKPAAQISIGKNAVGEDCTQTSPEPGAADVYCGTWQEPSARVHAGGAGNAQLAQLATASPWRDGIDTRFRCDPPTATTILNGSPAELMQCTRLVGGWPHVAMVADVGGKVWYADGVLPAATRHGALDRRAGRRDEAECRAGQLRRGCAAGAAPGGAGVQLGRRRPVRGADGGGHPRQPRGQHGSSGIRLPRRAGAAAEAARQGQPETATTIMSLALQLSNEGRFAEADALFAQAAQLAPHSAEPHRAGAAAALSRAGCDEPGQAGRCADAADRRPTRSMRRRCRSKR